MANRGPPHVGTHARDFLPDLHLSMEMVSKRELKLVGISAMFIAGKYQELRCSQVTGFICMCPQVIDFIIISDWEYSRKEILAKEKAILDMLERNLIVPTPYVFLLCFMKAAFSDKLMEHMVFFLAKLGLMHYPMITYPPSMFAASAVYAAQCTLGETPLWSETLKHYTGFSEAQLRAYYGYWIGSPCSKSVTYLIKQPWEL